MFARPGDGALVPLALIAAFALVNGIAEFVVAIGGMRLIESDLRRACGRRPNRPRPDRRVRAEGLGPSSEPTPSA
jgi:hypothetical protein